MEKKRDLDLKDILNAIDSKDFDFYSRLSDKEKKAYIPKILMRYVSSLKDDPTGISIMATNMLVNKEFWALYGHEELIHKLFCICGSGKRNSFRTWISPYKEKGMTKLRSFIRQYYDSVSNEELDIIIKSFDTDELKTLINESGLPDKEIKELLGELKK